MVSTLCPDVEKLHPFLSVFYPNFILYLSGFILWYRFNLILSCLSRFIQHLACSYLFLSCDTVLSCFSPVYQVLST